MLSIPKFTSHLLQTWKNSNAVVFPGIWKDFPGRKKFQDSLKFHFVWESSFSRCFSTIFQSPSCIETGKILLHPRVFFRLLLFVFIQFTYLYLLVSFFTFILTLFARRFEMKFSERIRDSFFSFVLENFVFMIEVKE